MKKAVIYARYSSDKQTEQSIEGQVAVCTKFAAENGYTIVGYYLDRAVTGRNDNRPEFKRMMADSAKGEWCAVIVYKGDRFARNRRTAQNNKHRLRNNGVKVVSATEYIPDSPEGILMESILEGYAEYYSAELAQKVKRGRTESYKKGHYTGGKVPFGLQIIDHKYAIHEGEAELMREIFARVANGDTGKSIATSLSARGAVTKRGDPITPGMVYRIIHAPYANGKVYIDGHLIAELPPIVDQDLIDVVDEISERNKKAPAKNRGETKYLLSGKIVCGECGYSYIGECGTSRTGDKHHYYTCSGRKRHKTDCDMPTLRKDDIESLVLDSCREVFTQEVIDKVATYAYQLIKEADPDAAAIATLEGRKRDAQKRIDALLNAIYAGIVSTTVQERLAIAEREVEDITQSIEERMARKRTEITKDKIVKYLSRYTSTGAMPDSLKRSIARNLIKQVIIYRDKICIVFNLDDGSDPNGGRRLDRHLTEADKERLYSRSTGADPADGSIIFSTGSPSRIKPNTIEVTPRYWCVWVSGLGGRY